MKKRDQRLQLHRETLHLLNSPELSRNALAGVNGGIQTSCIGPDCCGNLEKGTVVE